MGQADIARDNATGGKATLTNSVRQHIRDDFNDVSLALPNPNPNAPNAPFGLPFIDNVLDNGGTAGSGLPIAGRWNVARKKGGAMTLTQAASQITIATGTVSQDWLVLTSVDPIRIPARAQAAFNLSQRIANQLFAIELVSADFTAGKFFSGVADPVAGTPNHGVQWLLDGVTATAAKSQTVNTGQAKQVAARTILTTASQAILELETYPDECYFGSRAVDSEVTGEANKYLQNTKVPPNNVELYLQIRAVNTGAAGGTTSMVVDFTNLLEIFESMVEVTGGRGGAANSQAIPTYQVNGPPAPAALADAAANPTTTAMAALIEGFNGATWDRIRVVADNADALAAIALGNLRAACLQFGYAPSAGSALWDRLRTANKFITLSSVVITAETTIWTPAAGRKFRLMGFLLNQGVLTGNVTLKDNTAGGTIFIIPANSAGVAIPANFGNGILSAAANNVLTATGVATETLSGTLFGTEE